MLMSNFLAAGPSIAIVATALDFFPDSTTGGDAGFLDAVSKVAYFFTTTALLQGVGNFVWVPLASKYGRRPVYVASYAVYLACAVWLVFEKVRVACPFPAVSWWFNISSMCGSNLSHNV